ncbi:MAG: maltose ABC transporter permease MalF [Oceanospirillaceae bacterium]|nr:maltose ABC transporter permease MalF [Oceanospirillaceae bacterium]
MSSYVLRSFANGKGFPNLKIGFKLVAGLSLALFGLYLVVALYAQQQIAFALLVLLVLSSAGYVYLNRRAYAHRYAYPAIAGMGVFVIFPLLYTVGIGFTNYSASNLLDLERVQAYHLSQSYQSDAGRFPFRLHAEGDRYSITLDTPDGRLSTKPFIPDGEKLLTLAPQTEAEAADALAMREVIKLRGALSELTLQLPGGDELRLSGLRDFAARLPVYSLQQDGSLVDNRSGERLTINYDEGFYQRADGELVPPGFVVGIGFDNYLKVVTDSSIRGPFLEIFIWTLVFAGGTVAFTLAVGLVLASLLQWDLMRGKALYRTLLILPYAVPAFISILVFKGLFNQNFGEINLVLQNLFGISPDWFSDPAMARTMILAVNTWLGYPYMMLLCMGLLQSIPQDLYEASAMDGAGPLDNLFKITLPLIIKPLTPLLIACFAFNFNNFVLITLLTGGSPDIIGASTPAGTTDLLVSYTYRIAFQDSGQNFGLAAAIATMIFLLVGGLSLLKMRLGKMEV